MEDPAEKNGRIAAQIVAIDGTAIRGIREAKKLTQLYVASVVGVTTDTISRWENNRYPTIKRDNAEKLAAALEVPLAEILRQEPPAEEAPPEAVPPPARRAFPRFFVVLVLLLVATAAVSLVIFRKQAPRLSAIRWAPSFAAPGQVIPVRIRVERSEGDSGGFIVKERFPSGWRFAGSHPPVAGEPGEREVKWLIPGGSGPVTISYAILVPRNATLKGRAAFDGEIVRSGGEAPLKEAVGGAQGIVVSGAHWADTNGDGRIDDNEIMPAYYLTEEMKGLGLDWKTVETIWSGAGYSWNDRLKSFEVVK